MLNVLLSALSVLPAALVTAPSPLSVVPANRSVVVTLLKSGVKLATVEIKFNVPAPLTVPAL